MKKAELAYKSGYDRGFEAGKAEGRKVSLEQLQRRAREMDLQALQSLAHLADAMAHAIKYLTVGVQP